MAFTAMDVKALREKTGVGMMECKKALTEADGDMDKAIDFLRERGFGDVRAQVGFQRNRVGGRRHIVGGDFLDLVDGVCDDVQFALQTGDFLIGERDSGQIAQMHDFFA